MKRLTLLIDADDTVLDFKNSERDAIIMLCEQFSIDGGEDVADKFKQINRRMWDIQFFPIFSSFASLFSKVIFMTRVLNESEISSTDFGIFTS